MSLSRYETVIIGVIFAVITLIVFDSKINELISISTNSEVKILLYSVWITMCLVMGFIFPIGLAKKDSSEL